MLTDELNRWLQAGVTATFWWRDDDAISDTEELDELLNCARQVPIALAVIPNRAEQSLALKIARYHSVTVLQHGWCHTNHTTEGSNSEYPDGRSMLEVAREFSIGRHVLSNFFGTQYLPVFAPPWHGFSDLYLSLLSQAGIMAISRKGARECAINSGLVVSNVHCAPILWSDPPSFSTESDYLSIIIDHLEGRRRGRYDSTEPTGILTHHLVQNKQSYAFMTTLSEIVSQHPAALWLNAREVFQL